MESRAALAPAPSVLASSRVAHGYVGAAIAAELRARKICARRREVLTMAPSYFSRETRRADRMYGPSAPIGLAQRTRSSR